jgi:transcription elongation factor GreB
MSEPNYITPEGAKRLAQELDHLLTRERPKVVEEVAAAAADGDRSENAPYIYGKKRLREIDRRIQFLTRRLDSAQVVSGTTGGKDRVFFGAWVGVKDESGQVREYRIVGEDEVSPDEGRISWRSPLGRALLRRAVDDVVTVRRPAGEIAMTIVTIRYESSA